jgi:hypothetical protein
MGIGVSVFLIAVGAVLAFAVDATVSGLDLDAVGVILMIVGAIGLLASLFLIDSWRRPAGTVVEGGPTVVRERRVVREDY